MRQYDFQFLSLPETGTFFEIMQQEKIEARFVGGCVRDAILGRCTKDYDIAVNSPIDRFANIMNEYNISYSDKWIKYGALKVLVDKVEFDVVALRRDVDCSGRDCSVESISSFEEDSKRRDFTINALYASANGEIFDYNDGLKDLKNREVIFVGDPEKRIVEDNVRILRYYRFCSRMNDHSARYSDIMKKHARLVQNIPKDRIRKELLEIINNAEIVNLMYSDKTLQMLTSSTVDIDSFNGIVSANASYSERLRALFPRDQSLLRLAYY